MLKPLRTRLLSRLIIDAETGCLLWTGAKDSRGYGHIRAGSRQQCTHRVMYEMFVGPIPDGTEIDHLCRNRSCASPAHLEAVSHRENLRRGMSPTAQHLRQTHCVKGHEFTVSNTLIRLDIGRAGGRECRACRREASRRYKARKRARNA